MVAHLPNYLRDRSSTEHKLIYEWLSIASTSKFGEFTHI